MRYRVLDIPGVGKYQQRIQVDRVNQQGNSNRPRICKHRFLVQISQLGNRNLHHMDQSLQSIQ